MNYDKVGTKIRKIREKELHKTREEFAEEIGFSVDTIARLENGKSSVKNIEAYINIAYLSGYSLDELLLDENKENEKEKIIKRINYLLNVINDKDELEYIYNDISNFMKFYHKDKVTTLKDIKKKYSKK